MSISEAVAERKLSSQQCKLGRLIDALPPEESEALTYALSKVKEQEDWPQQKRQFTIAWIVEMLNDNQHPIGKTVVSEHLARKCACDHS